MSNKTCIRVKSNSKANKFQDHLYYLFLKWKSDPDTYGHLMLDTVDKIITDTIKRNPNPAIDEKLEELDDLRQDLRVKCFSLLKNKINIDNLLPHEANKKIYNYLQVTITYFLMDKHKDVRRRKESERNILNETIPAFIEDEHEIIQFQNPTHNEIARLRIQGFNFQEIRDKLNLSQSQLKTMLQNMETQLRC
jgi:hypothetical protein